MLLGGGPVPPGLAEEAVEAGWPVLPTYGQTEAASQVATCPPETPGLRAARPPPAAEVSNITVGLVEDQDVPVELWIHPGTLLVTRAEFATGVAGHSEALTALDDLPLPSGAYAAPCVRFAARGNTHG